MLSATIFLVSCAQTEARLQDAGKALGQVEAVKTVRVYVPAECNTLGKADVRPGDRLDEAVLKYDAALQRQNRRTETCYAWIVTTLDGIVQVVE